MFFARSIRHADADCIELHYSLLLLQGYPFLETFLILRSYFNINNCGVAASYTQKIWRSIIENMNYVFPSCSKTWFTWQKYLITIIGKNSLKTLFLCYFCARFVSVTNLIPVSTKDATVAPRSKPIQNQLFSI